MASGRDEVGEAVSDELELGGEHWNFALRLYSQPGVQDAALYLQDRFAVDVIVLFTAIFAAVDKHRRLDAAAVAAADSQVRAWRTSIVHPLRSIRRAMKTAPELLVGPASQELRSSIKAAELRAEQIELALLADWLSKADLPTCTSIAVEEAVETVVAHFARSLDPAQDVLPRHGPHRDHIAILTAAACEMTGGGTGPASPERPL